MISIGIFILGMLTGFAVCALLTVSKDKKEDEWWKD